MSLKYASKLGLKVCHTNVGAQKIDGFTLERFGMVLASFQVENKLGKARFFQKIFLLADISVKVVLGMLFLTFSNLDIKFADKKLTWRSYTATKALPTTKRVEIIDKKKFAKAALDENVKTFVVHVTSVSTMHPAREAEIVLLLIKEVVIPAKYLDFANVFSEKKAAVLLEQTDLNQHAIKLQDSKQPPYGLIYSLEPIELKTLKTYIETNLANSFIRPLKSSADAPIFFVQKSDGSLWLCVDY